MFHDLDCGSVGSGRIGSAYVFLPLGFYFLIRPSFGVLIVDALRLLLSSCWTRSHIIL